VSTTFPVLAEGPKVSAWVLSGERYADRGLDLGVANGTGDYLTSLEGEVGLSGTGEKGGVWRFRYNPVLAAYTRDSDQRRFSHLLSGRGTWIISPRVTLTAGERYYRIRQQIGLVNPDAPDDPGFLLRTSERISNDLSLNAEFKTTERNQLRVGSRYFVGRLSDEAFTDVDTYVASLDWDFRASSRSTLWTGYEYSRFDFSTTTSSQTQQLEVGGSWMMTSSFRWRLSGGASQVQHEGTSTTEPVAEWALDHSSASSRARWAVNLSRDLRGVVGLEGPVINRRASTTLLLRGSDRLRYGASLSYGRKRSLFDPSFSVIHHRRAGLHLDYQWTSRFFSRMVVSRHDQRVPSSLFSDRRVNYYYVGVGYQIWPSAGSPGLVPEGDTVQ